MNKKFIKIALCAILMVISVVWLQGCKRDAMSLSAYKPISNTKLDSVRIFNLLPDSTKSPRYATYVLYVNDSLFYNKYSYSYNNTAVIPGSPPAVPVSANGGTYVFKVARFTYQSGFNSLTPPRKADPKTIIYTSTITVTPHSGFSNMVFYIDANGKYNSQYIPQAATTEPAPDAGKYKIRVVNFGYHIPAFGPFNSRNFPQYPLNSAGKQFPIQVQYADSTVVPGMSAVPFASVSPYMQLDYGTQQFLVYNNLTDSAKYIKNSYTLSDMGTAFGLGGGFSNGNTGGTAYVNQYPYYTNFNPGYSSPPPGPALGNIASYPFNAGGVYTIYVFGNMYNAVLDKQYGATTLDNFGRLQIVNTNFNQPNMQVSIQSASGTVQIPSVAFGSYSNPVTVPAGKVTVTFSAQGTTLYTYQTQIPRLGNYTLYYTSGLNNIPSVFPQSNNLNTPDFSTTTGALMQTKISLLNMSPDAGALFATGNPINGYDARVSGDFTYETIVPGGVVFDGRSLAPGTIGGIPDVLNVRLTSSRADSLASKLVITAKRLSVFKSLPAPGTYTLTVAGLLNTTDPAKKLRLIMVKQSNFISKAN